MHMRAHNIYIGRVGRDYFLIFKNHDAKSIGNIDLIFFLCVGVHP